MHKSVIGTSSRINVDLKCKCIKNRFLTRAALFPTFAVQWAEENGSLFFQLQFPCSLTRLCQTTSSVRDTISVIVSSRFQTMPAISLTFFDYHHLDCRSINRLLSSSRFLRKLGKIVYKI